MLEDNIGYIQLTEFDTVTVEQFNLAVEELTAMGADRFIFDLRDNGGGLLSSVCDILDTILPKGLLVYTEDKNGEKTEYKSTADEVFDKPLVVLVNGDSASASEIFAGAIQDYGVGTIVGTQTFGKGIVQQMIALGDGSAVKLTISKYYTPNGVCIHGSGIEPDIELEFDAEKYLEDESDNQLQKAIEVLSKN